MECLEHDVLYLYCRSGMYSIDTVSQNGKV